MVEAYISMVWHPGLLVDSWLLQSEIYHILTQGFPYLFIFSQSISRQFM